LTPAEYPFFYDPADIYEHEMLGFSVHTRQMAEMAHRRGFGEIKNSHLTHLQQMLQVKGGGVSLLAHVWGDPPLQKIWARGRVEYLWVEMYCTGRETVYHLFPEKLGFADE
jgi:hypothetical protein